MFLKLSIRTSLIISFVILGYLAVVYIWALLSVENLMQEAQPLSTDSILSSSQTDILLKIEDPTFYKHIGIDVSEGQGLTTITSSLARDIFILGKKLRGIKGGFQSFYIKVFSCCKKIDLGRDMMALALNQSLTKEQQLTLYISSSYMGGHNGKQIIGLPAAAYEYFNKPISDLTDHEFITLIAMLKAPNYFHPYKNANNLNTRVDRIKMIIAGTCKPDGWLDTKYEHCTKSA
ncbi:Penicillin-binding protein 1B [Thalassocella blandensis]|nr:Penicillin-binding protein 1B [Thalassocella blandensis]